MRYILSLCVLFVVFSGCRKDPKEKLPGTWKIVKVNFNTPDVAPEDLARAEKIAKSSVYIFRKDGTASVRSDYIPEGVSGSWEINARADSLWVKYIRHGNPEMEEYQLLSLENNAFTVYQDLKEVGNISMDFRKQ